MTNAAVLDLNTEADQVLVITGVDSAGYERYLNARGERSRPKIIYLDGDLILVSPSRPHERMNVRIGTFLYEVIVNLRLQVLRLGQMTWRRGDGPGVEGDQTYYLANEPLVRDKKIDLEVDPPPDLAIEVVHTHKADHALEVHGRLGVPEVWVCDADRVAIHLLQADGTYQEAERSRALPFLSAAEIFARIQQPAGMTEIEWIDDVRRWVREVLVPRVHPE